MNVNIKRLHPDAVIPKYAHESDAGVDLVATEDVIVEPGETVKVPTGIAISLPPGYEAQVRPRSGITLKTKLRVQIGTIDCQYRGEIGVIVDNIGPNFGDGLSDDVMNTSGGDSEYDGILRPTGTYLIRKGERIAQLVIAPVEQAKFIEVESLEETTRGAGGFGSSGVSTKEEN